jgi:hypothetical protein
MTMRATIASCLYVILGMFAMAGTDNNTVVICGWGAGLAIILTGKYL